MDIVTTVYWQSNNAFIDTDNNDSTNIIFCTYFGYSMSSSIGELQFDFEVLTPKEFLEKKIYFD